MTLDRIIRYKNKKHSSGRIKDGVIILEISSRLSVQEKERHIKVLTQKLSAKYDQIRQIGETLPVGGSIQNDEDLRRLAGEINQKHYGFEVKKVCFNRQHTLWGSCNYRQGIIRLSHRLMGAPDQLISYVLIHELCHLKVPNHGKEFWSLVAVACPSYQEIRKKLQAYGILKKYLD